MGEISVYYVPENQDAWSGRREELADRMWELGVFLHTDRIVERIEQCRREGLALPDCQLDIRKKFGYMGITDGSNEDAVPNYLYDIKCPSCSGDMMQDAFDIWGAESELPDKERPVTCSTCGATFVAKDLRYGEPMEFARFYVMVSGCDQEQWDPNFRKVLESIVGPCREYWEWST